MDKHLLSEFVLKMPKAWFSETDAVFKAVEALISKEDHLVAISIITNDLRDKISDESILKICVNLAQLKNRYTTVISLLEYINKDSLTVEFFEQLKSLDYFLLQDYKKYFSCLPS